MQKHLFLDDYRNPENVTWVDLPRGVEWIIVRSYAEFVAVFDKIPMRGIAHISYDHDLVKEHYANHPTNEKTGFDCAKFVVAKCKEEGIDVPDYTVHSLNPKGREAINELLENYRKYQLESSNRI